MTSAPSWLGLLLAGLVGMTGCRPAAGITRFGGGTMGTTYEVTYRSTGAPVQNETRAVEALLGEINQSISTYIGTSLISRVNASSDTKAWHPIDSHFQTIFDRSHAIYQDTGGAFNPAVGPLVNAWGFGPAGPQALPGDAMVASLLELANFEAFEIRPSPPGLRKRSARAQLDFSAIAKGYAVDAIAALLERGGVRSYFVEIGGEVRTRGEHPEGRPWRAGIEQPTGSAGLERRARTVLLLNDAALATSGNYRNFRVQDGRKVVHILNPKTGYPEITPLLSVTVLARDTMTADAYATAFMVMGSEAAFQFVQARDGLEAYFISVDRAGNYMERRSPGFPHVRTLHGPP